MIGRFLGTKCNVGHLKQGINATKAYSEDMTCITIFALGATQHATNLRQWISLNSEQWGETQLDLVNVKFNSDLLELGHVDTHPHACL